MNETQETILSLDDFHSIALAKNIFTENTSVNFESSLEVANDWFLFSCYMPYYLSSAASLMPNNEMRSTLIEIANEELGEGKINNIHAHQFKKACETIGLFVGEEPPTAYLWRSQPTKALNEILVNTAKHPYKILGVSFGLEIIANENIEYLFNQLCYQTDCAEKLESTYFFKEHRQNEDHHIAINYRNYTSFCNDLKHFQDLQEGFHKALEFWQGFWASKKSELKWMH